MGKLNHWAVAFGLISALYAALAFGGSSGRPATIAEIVFWVTAGLAVAFAAAAYFRSA